MYPFVHSFCHLLLVKTCEASLKNTTTCETGFNISSNFHCLFLLLHAQVCFQFSKGLRSVTVSCCSSRIAALCFPAEPFICRLSAQLPGLCDTSLKVLQPQQTQTMGLISALGEAKGPGAAPVWKSWGSSSNKLSLCSVWKLKTAARKSHSSRHSGCSSPHQSLSTS